MSDTASTLPSRPRTRVALRTTATLAALAVGVGLAAPAAVAAPSAAPSAAPNAAPIAAPNAAAAATASRMPALPGGNVALTWAPLYMADQHEYSRGQAVELAREFDLISAMPYGLSMHSDAMRQANPDLTLLAYSNATLAQPELVRGLPEAAFAHDARGNRIKASHWDTFLMQPDNSQWRATADKLCRDRSVLGGFDGCLVDMLTLGIYAKGEMTGLPAAPGTGRAYSEAQYRDQMVSLAADLRRRSPNLVQIGNMVENSYRYWDSDVSSRPLVSSSPSAQMEDFLRGAHDGANDFPSVAEWRKNVQVITDMESSGKVGLFTTKVWSGAGNDLAAQWQGYAMASFLMGAGGKSFFAFTRSRDKSGATQSNAAYEMPDNLGMPQGGMRELPSGAFVRDFANGLAVVNPTSSPVRVDVPGSMRRLNGRAVPSLVLPARSGEVLTTAKASPFKVHISPAGKAAAVKAGGWSKVKVKVSNRGGKATPRGTVMASGKKISSRKHKVPALRPSASRWMRVALKIKARPGQRAAAKLVYVAGGKRDVVRVPVRVVRGR